MKRITLFLLIAVVAVSSAEAQKVKRKSEKEKDGFSWCLLKQDDFRGAENNSGTIIIPLEKKFSSIKYRKGYFIAKDIFSEIYDTLGNVVIPIERHYDQINPTIVSIDGNDICNVFKFRIPLGNNEYRHGICDKNGVEIIPPVYDAILYIPNGIIMFSKYFGGNEVRFYTGYKFDNEGNIVLDPDHPIDTTDSPVEYNYDQTAYNNSSSGSYNNTYTPPAQHKQQSTGNKSTGTTQPKSTPKSSANTSSSSKPSNTRTPKDRTHPFENYNKPVKCANCSGTGMARCWSCSGKGTIRKSGIDKNGKQVFRNERCTGCNGSGKIKCTVCNGKGVR